MSNPIVDVSIAPVSGTNITQLGMFNISVTPINATDQILNLQYVVSTGNQTQGDFVAFAFIGTLSQGAGFPSSIFYCSCDGVNANQNGQSLIVQVVGAINNVSNVFDVSQTFTANLWPGGTCSAGSSGASRKKSG